MSPSPRGLVGAPSQRGALHLLVRPTALYGGTSVALVVWGTFSAGPRALVHAGGGVLLWTLGEYILHRWVQHGPPHPSFHLDNHASHHRAPEEVGELVYALRHSAPALAAAAVLAWLCTSSLPAAAALLGGVVAGYVTYEWIHMGAHAPALWGGRAWLERLSAHHLAHHFGAANKNYGFLTSVWDRLFGTYAR